MAENLWYVDKDGDLHRPEMPYAPEKPVKTPFPSALWRVSGENLTHEIYPETPEKAVFKPFPSALWRVSGENLTHEIYPETPEKAIVKPFPDALWRINENINYLPYHILMPLEIPAGAFMGAEKLEYVRIPETVRKIGRYAFADTSLGKVKISPECEYFGTSFPENCLIEFYGNVPDEHSGQLYDCNNHILTDYDGARIYAGGI